jgi:glyoxylase-like metal-dependent hydrolase (beta-lactamase superfamily II)
MLKVKKFVFNYLQENTFVLYAENGDAAIVDPGCNSMAEEQLLQYFIDDNNLNPKYLVNTHGHFDHILGNAFVMSFYTPEFVAHQDDMFLLENLVESAHYYNVPAVASPKPDRFLLHGERLTLGDDFIEILHLPGHSPGSVGLYSPSSAFIVVGDVLFKGSIGRTDLPMGNYDTLMNSINNTLFALPHDTVVYPGHGPATSLGIEFKTNPFLI